MENIAIHKELNFNCQIEVKWPGHKNLITTFNHDQVELLENMGLQNVVDGEETATKSTCARTQTNFYNPNEEDAKIKAFKAEGKK